MTAKKNPYSQRTDLEKIQSNWNKIVGLFERGEWSSAIVRAATACEIAANLRVREELQRRHGLDPAFVDSLLKWANGIQGKFDRLLLPSARGKKARDRLKRVKPKVDVINRERNAVVHSGVFKKRESAEKIIALARHVVLRMVKEHHKKFELEDIG